ncbi:MAG: alanine--tRNA ligase-related protein, partial [Anaerolineae bacterium]
CSFVGYQEISARSQVKALIVEGAFVDKIEEGQEAEILLDQTPFYPEKGGQVADIGTISTQDARFIVKDCKSPYPDVIVHIGKMEKGTLSLKESVLTEIDFKRRQKIANHHTATHLLHYALQKVLGSHIRQSGSLVEPERLRFDFNHHKALDSHEIRKIEELVNEKVRQDSPVKVYEISYEEAQKQSDIKQFFGDKYGHKVRVVEAEESKELCGGTHTHRLGTIGLFRILKESSIAAGVRRIEAAVGKDAEAFMYSQEDLALAAAATLRVPVAKLVEKVSFLSEENKKFSGALKNYKRAAIKELALELAKKARRVDDLPLLTALVPLDPEDLIPLSEDLIAALESLVLILACKAEGRCQLFVKVTPDLVQKGLSASAIVKEIASCIGGSGGGKADSAQAGGKLSEGIEQAFQKAEQLLAAWTS